MLIYRPHHVILLNKRAMVALTKIGHESDGFSGIRDADLGIFFAYLWRAAILFSGAKPF